ncbi:hypothetical protein ACP70R_030357 [Stipagrostis hirtigluma subsp. patula]
MRPRRWTRSLRAAEEEGAKTKTAPPPSEKPGQERRVQIGAEMVGGGGEAAVAGRRSDHEILVKMDAQLLDCSICFDPLKPPIYQCEVGHVICFACRGKLCNTCPSCGRGIGYCRCFALEQMVDSIKAPCTYANYGCDQFITYYQKEKHEKTCMHAPCFCPEDGCSFRGSTGSLLDHFVTKHQWSPTMFHYDKTLRISIPRRRRFTLFVAVDRSMFLLVNTSSDIGNALTTVCIRPHESGSSYSSKISAVHRVVGDKGRYVFQMDPHVSSSSLYGGVQLGRFFLLVPPELVDESTDELTINLRVEKINSASLHH